MTADGTNATVCFGITRGNLAKDVSINVRTVDGSAVGKRCACEGVDVEVWM